METYEYVPCDADFDVLPIVVEEGSSDGVDPEENGKTFEKINSS